MSEEDPELAKFFEEIEQTATQYKDQDQEQDQEQQQDQSSKESNKDDSHAGEKQGQSQGTAGVVSRGSSTDNNHNKHHTKKDSGQQQKPMYSASAVAATAPPQHNPPSSSSVPPGPSMPSQFTPGNTANYGGGYPPSNYYYNGSSYGEGYQQQGNRLHGAQPSYQWQQSTASAYQQQPGASGMTAASPYQRQQPPKSGKKHVRVAGGQMWVDPTLEEWPENDFRLFVGDIGNECTDETLAKPFEKFPSFAKAKVVLDKKTGKTKGYGFVSFLDAMDAVKAMREVNGKYIGNRPCKIKKSRWKERELASNKTVRKEQKMLVQLNKTAKKK